MDIQEQQLIDAIKQNPNGETAKVQYERYLDQARPEAVERQLLRLEREIAASYLDQAALTRLIDEYVAFRIQARNYLGDYHSLLEPLHRTFKVWLVSFAKSRMYAVRQALRFECKMNENVDLEHLPLVIESRLSPITARNVKESVLGFIQRYKGPTGNEPDVEPDEVQLAITPSWLVDW